jgi:hypothetical protein
MSWEVEVLLPSPLLFLLSHFIKSFLQKQANASDFLTLDCVPLCLIYDTEAEDPNRGLALFIKSHPLGSVI